MDFSKSFSVGAKSGEICFLPLEIEKTRVLLTFSNSRPLPTPIFVCRIGKSSCHTIVDTVVQTGNHL